MKLKHLIGLTVSALAGGAAPAQISSNEFIREADKGGTSSNIVTAVVGGYGQGLMVANAEGIRMGNRPLFCVPRKLPLLPSQDVEMLRRYVKEHPKDGATPPSVVLLWAYQSTFPCSGER